MFEDLKEIICEYVDVAPETIKEDSRFIEDLGFNSYDFMSMDINSRCLLQIRNSRLYWNRPVRLSYFRSRIKV